VVDRVCVVKNGGCVVKNGVYVLKYRNRVFTTGIVLRSTEFAF